MNKGINKEKIIRSAALVISKKGLENTTVNDIAKEAGIAKGSIYVYFKSRDELLEEAVKYTSNMRIAALEDVISILPTAKAKLKLLLHSSSRLARENPELFMMNYSLLISTHKNIKTKVAKEEFKKYLNFVESIVREGVEKGEFRVEDTRLAAFMILITQDMAYVLSDIDNRIIDTSEIDSKLIKFIY